MAVREADKLIISAARDILKPMGLFQKGRSRIWIDDNGWFLTVVEFQPSAWSKGAYLNVGISFLWEQGHGLSEALPYNIGGRELNHIEYTGNDEIFSQQMLEMAQHAGNLVQQYRNRFASFPTVLSEMERYHDPNSSLKVVELWNRGMFYYLFVDEKSGDEQMKELLLCAKKEREYRSGGKALARDWVVERIQLTEELLSSQAKKQSVLSSIIEKRQRLRGKSSFKRLPVTSVFL